MNVLGTNKSYIFLHDQLKLLTSFKDTVMEIEKSLINHRLRVSKVS